MLTIWGSKNISCRVKRMQICIEREGGQSGKILACKYDQNTFYKTENSQRANKNLN